MNNSATGPPTWPFSEATALTQAQRCTKLPRHVVGAHSGLALRNFCSLMQTGVGSGCRCTTQPRNNFTGKGNESWGLRPGTRRDGPTTLYSPPNNEELNHAEARLTFVCFLFWVSFEKTVLLLCEV